MNTDCGVSARKVHVSACVAFQALQKVGLDMLTGSPSNTNLTCHIARARAGWERAMLEALRKIRAQEAGHAVKMARIRACNMALYFAIMPIVSFITFAVVPPRRWRRGACAHADRRLAEGLLLGVVHKLASVRPSLVPLLCMCAEP